MRSEAQIAASRANGSKSHGPITDEGKRMSAANAAYSTGPRTPEGKARCAQNPLRHQLLAKSVVLPNEKSEEFIALVEDLKEINQPVGNMEERFVETMAAAEWRRRRVWCLETARMAYATRIREQAGDELANELNLDIPSTHTAMAMDDLSGPHTSLSSLRRYETAFGREYTRARNELLVLQVQRAQKEQITKQTEPKPQSDPMHVHSCNSWPSGSPPDQIPVQSTPLIPPIAEPPIDSR